MSAKKPPAPTATIKLPVGEGHTLHVEVYGNPRGIPVLNLHGGPGSGSKPDHALRYPAKYYRIILFDQRGCGKSTSKKGPFHANTIAHTLADIEHIRTYLGIEKWVVAGSSWGSTLLLAYAQKHTARVLGLLPSAVFMGTPQELEWFSHPGGLARFFPLEYAELVDALGNPSQAQFFATEFKRLSGPRATALKVAKAHTLLDGMSMEPAASKQALLDTFDAKKAISGAQMWAFYAANNFFLKPNQLPKGLKLLKNIPTHITHGALDMCCPPESAHILHVSLPQSTLTMVPMCGHRATPEMDKARVAAAEKLAKHLLKSAK